MGDPIGAARAPHHAALDDFLVGYTNPNTAYGYAHDVRAWFAWCDTNDVDPMDCRRVDVERWKRHLIEHRYATASVARMIDALRSFYRAACGDGWLDVSPAEYVRLPRRHRDPASLRGYDRLEMIRLIQAAKGVSVRHHAAVLLAGTMGLRATEIAAVDVEDLRLVVNGYRVLRVHGKGSKPRDLPVPVAVGRVLDRAADGRNAGPVLLNRVGNRMDRHSVTKLMFTAGRHAGFDPLPRPHDLRRSAITNALDAGVPHRDVADMAGHTDVGTTSQYDRNRGSLDRSAVHVLSAYLAA